MRKKRSLMALVFLFPFLILFVITTVCPVVYGMFLSLFGQRGARMWFVGGQNYLSTLTDPQFWSGFGIPAFLLFIQIPLMIILAIFMALLFERVKGSAFFRLVFYLPYALPGVIAGIIWAYMFSKSMSPFVPLFKFLGVMNPEFLTQSSIPWILLVIILWEWTGYTALVLYSTLVSIPPEYAEAAQMDGATKFQISWYIKIPLLKNTIILLIIFNTIGALQVFNEPRMLAGLVTLPPNFTPAMYIYNQAFSYGAFTYAITIGLVLAVIIFGISFLFLKDSMKELDDHA